MENAKMIKAIEKKMAQTVKAVKGERINDKGNTVVSVDMADEKTYAVEMKPMKNQYGTYYKVIEVREYKIKETKPATTKKTATKKTVTPEELKANLDKIVEIAKEESKERKTPVYVVQNERRADTVYSEKGVARQAQYGYKVVFIFKAGVQVEATA